MTIGISKEELRRLRDHYFSLGINPVIDINNLIEQCKELNPWLPIDENTPKDRKILLYAGVPVIGWFDNIKNVWRCTDSKKLYATHYQELPSDPKDINNDNS